MPKPSVIRALVVSLVCATSVLGRDESSRPPCPLPLNDLGPGRYAGQQGGLYPRGVNMPPAHYAFEGLEHAERVVPLDGQGRPSPDGRIGFLMLGTASSRLVAQTLEESAASDPQRNAAVVTVNAAIGTSLANMAHDDERTWTVLPRVVVRSGITPAQVQVLWLDATSELAALPFPANAQQLQSDVAAVVRNARQALPNLRVVYLSSGVYGGFDESQGSAGSERGALDSYESAFALKWLIESRIEATGPAHEPWMAWGPYLWADDAAPRSDGLVWTRGDFGADGHFLSMRGAQRAASRLLAFLHGDATAGAWYRADGGPACHREALASLFGMERVGEGAPSIAVSALPKLPSPEPLTIAVSGAPASTAGAFLIALDPGAALRTAGPLLLSPASAHLVPVTTDASGRAWLELGAVPIARKQLCGRVLCVQFVSAADGALIASPGLRLQAGH